MQVLSRYRLTNELLGRGSFADVYKGYDLENSQHVVAVKQIRTSKLAEKELECVQMEATMAVELSHPNIVKCYGIIKAEHTLSLVLEYCDGGTLEQLFDNLPKTSAERESMARYYMAQLAQALSYLYKLGIIHRDLKPSNILLTDGQKQAKLSDFGFARVLKPDDLSNTICGSPLYMAPEVFIDGRYNHKADTWSFGMILYHCLYGKTAYSDCRNLEELHRAHKGRKLFFPKNIHVSMAVLDLLSKTLNKNQGERLSWEQIIAHPWFTGESLAFEQEETRFSKPITIKPKSEDVSISYTPPKVIEDYVPHMLTRSLPSCKTAQFSSTGSAPELSHRQRSNTTPPPTAGTPGDTSLMWSLWSMVTSWMPFR